MADGKLAFKAVSVVKATLKCVMVELKSVISIIINDESTRSTEKNCHRSTGPEESLTTLKSPSIVLLSGHQRGETWFIFYPVFHIRPCTIKESSYIHDETHLS